MDDTRESKAIKKLRERLEQGNLRGVSVRYRESGGMPAQGRIGEEVHISADSNRVTARIAEGTRHPQESSKQLAPSEVRSLLNRLAEGIDSLVPRSQARFLPDSVLGSITIDIDGEKSEFFFLIDEEDRKDQNRPISPAMAEVAEKFANLSQQLLRKDGR